MTSPTSSRACARHSDARGTRWTPPPDLATAHARLREAHDVVVLDVLLPDGSGIDLLAEIAAGAPNTVVIVMSGYATIDTAVRATRLGAFDFLKKPIALERLLVLLRNAAASRALEAENRRFRHAWSIEDGNVTRAAERLGLERSHLYKKLCRLGMNPES